MIHMIASGTSCNPIWTISVSIDNNNSHGITHFFEVQFYNHPYQQFARPIVSCLSGVEEDVPDNRYCLPPDKECEPL